LITSANNPPFSLKSQNSSESDPFFHESIARRAGYRLIAGVDEAGRGPLAGPVVAAAVIIPEGILLAGVKDSKKMTEKAREKAFPLIDQMALAIGIGVVSHRGIDDSNILKASLEAMKQAVLYLDLTPEYILVDGINEVPVAIPQKCLKRGDQLSMSISAASVMAKVYRDRIMCSYGELFPEYGFLHNKGYGTARHLVALQKYGPTPMHRLTFKGVR
jgi:ribonuclease HII